MKESGKVKLSHTRRAAFVYIRQSSPSQVEYNRESTARQYALVERACDLGWANEQVIVVDEDLVSRHRLSGACAPFLEQKSVSNPSRPGLKRCRPRDVPSGWSLYPSR
jgi:hypothetical protein